MSNQPPLPNENPYQPPEPKPGAAPVSGQPEPGLSKDVTQMAMLAHLLGLFLGFLGPLIIYLTKKDENEFIEDQAKESLNFQITLMIAYLVAGAVFSVFVFVTCGFGIFLPFPLIITVFQFVYGIQGTMRASEGIRFRYPDWICFRIIT